MRLLLVEDDAMLGAALRASPRTQAMHIELDVPALAVRADPESLPIALRSLCGKGLRVELVLPAVDDRQHGRAGSAVP